MVSAGGGHTALLRSDGRAAAVGHNDDGRCDLPALEEGVHYIASESLPEAQPVIIQLFVAHEPAAVSCRNLLGEEVASFMIDDTETAAAFRQRVAAELHATTSSLQVILPNGSRLRDLDMSQPVRDLLRAAA